MSERKMPAARKEFRDALVATLHTAPKAWKQGTTYIACATDATVVVVMRREKAHALEELVRSLGGGMEDARKAVAEQRAEPAASGAGDEKP